MLIPEEQPAQPALPVQPDGTRVVCGHCGNTFLVSKAPDSPTHLVVLSLKLFVVSTFKGMLPDYGIIEALKLLLCLYCYGCIVCTWLSLHAFQENF